MSKNELQKIQFKTEIQINTFTQLRVKQVADMSKNEQISIFIKM